MSDEDYQGHGKPLSGDDSSIGSRSISETLYVIRHLIQRILEQSGDPDGIYYPELARLLRNLDFYCGALEVQLDEVAELIKIFDSKMNPPSGKK